MRTTPIGMVLLNDERPHVTQVNEEANRAVLRRWTKVLVERIELELEAERLGEVPDRGDVPEGVGETLLDEQSRA